MSLNLNFPPELMLHTFLLHLWLKQHLQRHNGLQLLHPGKVDVTEFALSQGPTNVKIIDGDFPETERRWIFSW